MRPSRTYSRDRQLRRHHRRSAARARRAARARGAPSARTSRPSSIDLARRSATSPPIARSERRLPRAVRPDQRTHSPALDRERDAVDDLACRRAVPRRRRSAIDVIVLDVSQDDREERRAEERGDDADRQLGRRDDRAREHVGEHEEARADEQRQRHDRAVARRDEQPDRVRDDDPDEADQPADRDGGRGADRRGDDDDQPHAPRR